MERDFLVFRVGKRLCALATRAVEETMRPLPIEPMPDVPAFVAGISLVRGEATPIVDLRVLLAEDARVRPARLVTLRLEPSRRVGLLVDEVLGVREHQGLQGRKLPPLLGDAADIVGELARLDGRLLTVLRGGGLFPDDAWYGVDGRSRET
jgi:chemotaxis signal transduction protein